jgi:predicted ArsR family transcriptional regulator
VQPRLAVSPEQLKLMSFGPRREIIAALANDPDLSARDLALRLRRPVTGLYRHLDLLLAAGLIRQSGERAGPKRPESLYALSFATFSAELASTTEEGRAVMSQAAARYASATVRKLARAIATGAARFDAQDANIGFHNTDLQLDREGVVAFQKLLKTFIGEARKLRVRNKEGMETLAVTILIAPTP